MEKQHNWNALIFCCSSLQDCLAVSGNDVSKDALIFMLQYKLLLTSYMLIIYNWAVWRGTVKKSQIMWALFHSLLCWYKMDINMEIHGGYYNVKQV